MEKEKSYTRKEGFFKSYKETQIFFQTWEVEKPRLQVVITHGHGEHSECYHRLIQFFEGMNINFAAWDLRGHGRSEGKRGFTDSFNDFVYDFEIFTEHIQNLNSDNVPVVYLAHSMGALIQEKFLISNTDFRPIAQVLSSPLLGFTLPVPSVKQVASKILNVVYPKLTLWNEITYDMLTKDPMVIKEYEKDHLRHEMISASIYLGMIENMQLVNEQVKKIKIPTLIQVSETDPVVSSNACKDFFQSLSSAEKRILLYGENAKHELYNDTNRSNVFKDLKKFLEGYLK